MHSRYIGTTSQQINKMRLHKQEQQRSLLTQEASEYRTATYKGTGAFYDLQQMAPRSRHSQVPFTDSVQTLGGTTHHGASFETARCPMIGSQSILLSKPAILVLVCSKCR